MEAVFFLVGICAIDRFVPGLHSVTGFDSCFGALFTISATSSAHYFQKRA